MLEEKVTAPDKTAAPAQFEPKIVAFCCNWCSYAGADGAGTARKQYPANVKIIRVPCSCRVNPLFILRAFQRGADGVIQCGCHPGTLAHGNCLSV